MAKDNIRKTKNKKCLFIITATVPLILSFGFAISHMYMLLVLACLLLFVIVGAFPFCRKSESLWAFVLVAVDSIPANVYLIYNFIFCDVLRDYNILFQLIGCVTAFCMILSIEEIFLGFITRLIWPKQYKLNLENLK